MGGLIGQGKCKDFFEVLGLAADGGKSEIRTLKLGVSGNSEGKR